VIRELWTLLKDKCHIPSGYVFLIFNSSEHITVNRPQTSRNNRKAALKTGHCELNAVSSNVAKLKN